MSTTKKAKPLIPPGAMTFDGFKAALAGMGFVSGRWDDRLGDTRILDNPTLGHRVAWSTDGEPEPTKVQVIIWSGNDAKRQIHAGTVEWPVNVLGYASLIAILPTLVDAR